MGDRSKNDGREGGTCAPKPAKGGGKPAVGKSWIAEGKKKKLVGS